MIKINAEQTDLEFGTGDICVTGGHFLNEKLEKNGLVTFSNQSAREIGTLGDIVIGGNYKLENFAVIMTFEKVESIDVVIRALEDAKSEMTI